MEQEKKKIEPTIVFTKYGFANYYPEKNLIEINEGLKDNPYLLNYVTKHELGHTHKFDLHHEAAINLNVMPKLIFFLFSHPKTWVDFLPMRFKQGELIYDINLILLYLLLFGVAIGGYFLFKAVLNM